MAELSEAISSELENIVKDIEAEGGKSYLVGGAVIDLLKEIPLKDWDIEVYNLNLQQLEDILSKHGKSNLVGKSFGIIKLRQNEMLLLPILNKKYSNYWFLRLESV